eukprot:Selendium_serpulae@DN3785_c0_g1_i2.p1
MTAGVGAFAMFLARQGNKVIANDLNPIAGEYTKINAAQNKVAENVTTTCLDARVFTKHILATLKSARKPGVLETQNASSSSSARENADDSQVVAREDLEGGLPRKRLCLAEASVISTPTASTKKVEVNDEQELERLTKAIIGESAPRVVHFIVNLPELSIKLLDSFRGLEEETGAPTTPTTNGTQLVVHCFCFGKGSGKEDDLESNVKNQIKESMGLWPTRGSVTQVRNVAPNKQMFWARFSLKFPRDS